MHWNYASERACAACYEPLPSDSPRYVTMCRRCFVNAKKRERTELLEEIDALRLQVSRLQLAARARQPTVQALDVTILRTLLQLCHPDKHGGSTAATRATQWLLEQRRSAGVH